MLISPEYQQTNRLMHEVKPNYGTSGHIYASIAAPLIEQWKIKEVLDYGCGKRTFEKALAQILPSVKVRNYDPCIPGFDAKPEPAEFVVCTDVLEHVEPDCLDAVLEDIKRCGKRGVFLTVGIVPANKHLPDGRNAHLIIEDERYWIPKLMEKWNMRGYQWMQSDILFIGEPRATPVN